MIRIWDIEKKGYWQDEDGNDLIYNNETAAKNMMFTEGYTKEFVETGVELHPYYHIDKTGYDLQKKFCS